MEKFDTFATVFGSSNDTLYETKSVENIARHRRLLENTLFFDRLLNAVGIEDAAEHYPPRNNASFKTLYNEILNTSVSDTHKAALVYYLRKDVYLAPEEFAEQTYLPERYRILIDGLWHLDRLRLKDALTYLTEPTLIPTFSEEILYTLSQHSQRHPELVLEYYNSTTPVLTTQKSLKAYFSALVSSSVTEAFFFTRTQPEHQRKYLFEQLVSLVHGSSAGETRAKRSVELVGLPLENIEEEWFEDYLLRGKGKDLYGAKDTVIVRRIAAGRGDDIASLAKEVKERRIDGVNWHDLARSLAVE